MLIKCNKNVIRLLVGTAIVIIIVCKNSFETIIKLSVESNQADMYSRESKNIFFVFITENLLMKYIFGALIPAI